MPIRSAVVSVLESAANYTPIRSVSASRTGPHLLPLSRLQERGAVGHSSKWENLGEQRI